MTLSTIYPTREYRITEICTIQLAFANHDKYLTPWTRNTEQRRDSATVQRARERSNRCGARECWSKTGDGKFTNNSVPITLLNKYCRHHILVVRINFTQYDTILDCADGVGRHRGERSPWATGRKRGGRRCRATETLI